MIFMNCFLPPEKPEKMTQKKIEAGSTSPQNLQKTGRSGKISWVIFNMWAKGFNARKSLTGPKDESRQVLQMSNDCAL